MASDTNEETFSCEYCEKEFDRKERLDEHTEESHTTSEDRGDSESAAAASTAASASTGSMTEENNESPSAAEPGEAVGPSGDPDDVRPERNDDQ